MSTFRKYSNQYQQMNRWNSQSINLFMNQLKHSLIYDWMSRSIHSFSNPAISELLVELIEQLTNLFLWNLGKQIGFGMSRCRTPKSHLWPAWTQAFPWVEMLGLRGASPMMVIRNENGMFHYAWNENRPEKERTWNAKH